jgi:hypothetical protein
VEVHYKIRALGVLGKVASAVTNSKVGSAILDGARRATSAITVNGLMLRFVTANN